MPFPFDLQSQLARSDNPLIKCSCGRDANLDMMRDVTPVAQLIGVTVSHICDSCLEYLFRTEKLSREAFYLAHGAPAAIIAIQAARDAGIRAARNVSI